MPQKPKSSQKSYPPKR